MLALDDWSTGLRNRRREVVGTNEQSYPQTILGEKILSCSRVRRSLAWKIARKCKNAWIKKKLVEPIHTVTTGRRKTTTVFWVKRSNEVRVVTLLENQPADRLFTKQGWKIPRRDVSMDAESGKISSHSQHEPSGMTHTVTQPAAHATHTKKH